MSDVDVLETWCQIGREQREATNGLMMVPMLVLRTAEGVKVLGLALGAEEWPEAFASIRDEYVPYEAILTADVYLRTMTEAEYAAIDADYRPATDPAAGNAIAVTRATVAGVAARHLPYGIDDAGGYVWGESRVADPTYSPTMTALQAMVLP